jgi:hypothetical protein
MICLFKIKILFIFSSIFLSGDKVQIGGGLLGHSRIFNKKTKE